jgi:protocatechuate 3,4-dioxygenase beta subunit
MKFELPTRRQILENCIVRGTLLASVPMSQSGLLAMWQKKESQKPTADNEIGPFFKKGAPESTVLRVEGDPGFPLHVSGRILDTRGQLVPDARIEIWQADHLGHYDIKGYRYRAKMGVNDKAEYQFVTVMPGHYPDRVCQHIHYIISAPGHKTLITQLYFATDTAFGGDPDKNYIKDPVLESRELIRPVTLVAEAATAHAAVTFELCLEKA